jgi:hypothetical protein
MPRLHLFEWEDQPWFPTLLRDGGTAFLAFAERTSGHGRLLFAPLIETLRQTGHTHLIDLCSGAGGPAAHLAETSAAQGLPVSITLTDRYPNLPALAALTSPMVSLHPEPVDAQAVPAELRGFRTIFNAFHHFQPDDARAILADAVRQGQPIGIFEVVSRELPMLLGLLLTPLTVSLSLPFWRPFRWGWVPLTYLLPIMQAFVLWDGLVSWLRIYSVAELQALVATLDAPGWNWQIGTLRLGNAPLNGTYLIGTPPKAQ